MSTDLVVTGASSQIGYCLLVRAAGRGESLTPLSRRRPGWAAGFEVDWIEHDLTGGWPRIACHELVHAAGLDLLPRLLPAARDAGLERLVAFSSTSVTVKRGSAEAAERELAGALGRAEDALLNASHRLGIRCVVLRPTLIYGVGLDRNLSAMARFIRRWRALPLPGPCRGLRQPVHAADLADLAVAALHDTEAPTGIYEVAGGTTLSYRDMAVCVFRALGLKPRIVTVPAPLCRAGLALLRRLPAYAGLGPALLDRLESDQVFDDAPARRALRWEPRPFEPTEAAFRPPASP